MAEPAGQKHSSAHASVPQPRLDRLQKLIELTADWEVATAQLGDVYASMYRTRTQQRDRPTSRSPRLRFPSSTTSPPTTPPRKRHALEVIVTTRLAELIAATKTPTVTDRYWSKIVRDDQTTCWIWTGALSGNGHGRFWIQHGLVVLAHRFRMAPQRWRRRRDARQCDPQLRQPAVPEPSTLPRLAHWSSNRVEYVQRRGTPTSPLRDVRGARGRALALREAARLSADVKAAADAGLSELDRHQATLW